MKEKSDIFSYLITNKDFRDWVKNPDEERTYFWKQWIEAHPEALEDVKKAREFIERMTFQKQQLSHFELDMMLGKIVAHEKPELKPLPKVPSIYSLDQWVKVAAILIFFITTSVLFDRFIAQPENEPVAITIEWKKAENPKGRKSKIYLPDGTIVNLNSKSELTYPKSFSDSNRIVELKGEAFFDVAKDENKPFIIKTQRMTTEVLGTSFNIKAYDENENHHVAVLTGLVKIKNILGEETYLRPNEMGLINKENKMDKTSFDIRQITGWKQGIITFKRASFSEIEEKLTMWYGVDFVVNKNFKMENVYSGEFVNETLENVMDGIAFSSGFKYKIQKKKVFIEN